MSSLNINFDIKEYKKEIVVILIYIVIFSALFLANNLLELKNEDKKFEEISAKSDYNKVVSITFSKEELEKEFSGVERKLVELEQKLPSDLDHRKINEMLAQISSSTGNVFNLGSTNVTEEKSEDGYSKYQAKVNSIQGNYFQVQSMLKAIEGFESKVTITQFNVTRDANQTKGNMTLTFYGKL